MIECMVKCRVTADASTGIDPVIGAKRRLVLLIYCLLLYSVIEIGISGHRETDKPGFGN